MFGRAAITLGIGPHSSYMVIPTVIRLHCSTTHIDASMCVVLQCGQIMVGITM